MINLYKILLTTLMLISMLASTANAKTSFTSYSDMCKMSQEDNCANISQEVKNLQIALNSDKKLKLDLKADGKWGENTHDAVKKFQEAYNISPVQGYVGNKTKKKLSSVYSKIKLPKIKKSNNLSALGTYASFRKSINLRKSFKVYKDKSLLKRANSRNTKLKIDISEQRVRLYVGKKVALDSPCTTGAKRKFEPNTKIYRDKRTPKGTFKITEKISNKRSTIFGKMYRNGKMVYKGDRRKYRGPKAKYKGAALKNWMRLTSSGIGLHASNYVKRNPGTNGCIRLPHKVARTIFTKVGKGTKVSIVN
jgi:lipoprotein-anchoring transpeptidase ErfK/SrfK